MKDIIKKLKKERPPMTLYDNDYQDSVNRLIEIPKIILEKDSVTLYDND